MLNFESELDRFFKRTNTHKISDLAAALDVSSSTIRTWRTRQKIPDSMYRKLELSFEEPNTDETITTEELKNSLMEGLFTAVQVRAMSIEDGVKIGDIANILMTELQEKHSAIFNEKVSKAS